MFQWMKQNRKRCYPFLKPLTGEGEDDYRFFDLESITSGLIIYEDVLGEGRKLLQEGSLSRLHMVHPGCGCHHDRVDDRLSSFACKTQNKITLQNVFRDSSSEEFLVRMPVMCYTH